MGAAKGHIMISDIRQVKARYAIVAKSSRTPAYPRVAFAVGQMFTAYSRPSFPFSHSLFQLPPRLLCSATITSLDSSTALPKYIS